MTVSFAEIVVDHQCCACFKLIFFSGYYMFIESSHPRTENNVAALQTFFMPAYEYCLQINYHMYGVSKF